MNLQTPLYPSTEHMFNDEMFARMKRGSYLINTARGKRAIARPSCERSSRAVWQATPATFGSRSRRLRTILGGACHSTE